jgi:membrane-associated phospholipid phosphatase
VITDATTPSLLAAVILPVVGHHTSHGAATGFWLGLLASVFAAVIPFGFVWRLVWLGRLTDLHIGCREQRAIPLLVGLGSIVSGLGVLILVGAPRELLALITAGSVGLFAALVVGHWWKVSMHTGVACGSAVILFLIFGPAATVGWPLVVAVGWARVQLGDHTIAQVFGGCVLGGLIAGIVFSLVR